MSIPSSFLLCWARKHFSDGVHLKFSFLRHLRKFQTAQTPPFHSLSIHSLSSKPNRVLNSGLYIASGDPGLGCGMERRNHGSVVGRLGRKSPPFIIITHKTEGAAHGLPATIPPIGLTPFDIDIFFILN